MIDFCIVRRDAQISVASAYDAAQLLRIPANRVIAVTANPKPPPKLPRWYWAMVDILVQATGRWPTKDAADRELMIRNGFFESFVISTDGDTRFTPLSKREWGAAEWREYLDKVIPYIIEHHVGETRAQFRDRVDRFLGIKLKEAWEE